MFEEFISKKIIRYFSNKQLNAVIACRIEQCISCIIQKPEEVKTCLYDLTLVCFTELFGKRAYPIKDSVAHYVFAKIHKTSVGEEIISMYNEDFNLAARDMSDINDYIISQLIEKEVLNADDGHQIKNLFCLDNWRDYFKLKPFADYELGIFSLYYYIFALESETEKYISQKYNEPYRLKWCKYYKDGVKVLGFLSMNQ